MADPPMAVVNACTRDGQGGSPTAVVIDDATLTDDDRHATARGCVGYRSLSLA
jgi:trans-2,3-dihydro-3-hydroxyanthranilate isomerase